MHNIRSVMTTLLGSIAITTMIASAQSAAEHLRRSTAWAEVPGRFQSIVMHPSNPKIRFAIGQNHVLYRSTTAGENWTPLNSPFPDRARQLAISTNATDTLYALGHGLVLSRSEDLGETWERIGEGIDAGDRPLGQLLVDPQQRGHLFLAGSAIWESFDGGKSFRQFHDSGRGEWFTALAMDRGDLLAASSEGSILRISHGSVLNVSTPRKGEISALAADEVQTGTIYVAYATPKSTEQEAQVYSSSDSGYYWRALDGEAPDQVPAIAVHALAIEPGESGRIYLATAAGVMVSSNGGATWQRESSGLEQATALALQSIDSQLHIVALDSGGLSFAAAASSNCKFTLSMASAEFMAEGGTGTVDVKASSSNCAWSVSESYSWIVITGGRSGKGNGSVSYRVSRNSSEKARQTSSLKIGGQVFTVKQSGAYACTYTLSPSKAVLPSAGGNGSFAIQTQAGCTWKLNAGGAAKLTTPASGAGPSTALYTVGSNASASEKLYIIELEGRAPGRVYSHTITVQAPPGNSPGNGGGSGGALPPSHSPVATVLTMSGINAQVGQTLTLQWSLGEVATKRPASGSVTIQVNGVPVCVTTATQCKYVVAAGTLAPGSYSIRASFPGNPYYLPSSATAVLNVRKADTNLALRFCQQTPNGGSVWVGPCPASTTSTFSATLRRTVDNAVLSGRAVRFFVNGTQIGTAVTKSAGLAELKIRLNLGSGVEITRVLAVFDGDTQHAATTRELLRPPSGAF